MPDRNQSERPAPSSQISRTAERGYQAARVALDAGEDPIVAKVAALFAAAGLLTPEGVRRALKGASNA